ncbi:hypothetical protein H696_00838 [Fonticula alba]|uniref:ABC transporter domain-containing protein n=1 Tax=Fonticula alba TaxID=691883 RepID=A0A058ZH83_FONAL|nr:hypothetical protein H696_00838 [Fonticula alba]KCV73298.1 hypothetical protein H696_00838 [Fonticula alba]|eukprot:XP_009492999.1 hypothetical protein H696_00838 [Fonticula alba]
MPDASTLAPGVSIPRNRSGLQTFWHQFTALLRKQALVTARSWKSTMLAILAPLLFTLLLIVLDLLPKSGGSNPYNPLPLIPEQPVLAIGALPECLPFSKTPSAPCRAIRYAVDPTQYYPNSTVNTINQWSHQAWNDPDTELNVARILDQVKFENHLADEDIEVLPDARQLNDFILRHPNTTGIGLIFHSAVPSNFSYTILFNSTYTVVDPRARPDGRTELQVALDRAIITLSLNDTLGVASTPGAGEMHPVEVDIADDPPGARPRVGVDLRAWSKTFPQMGYTQALISSDEDYGMTFYFAGLTLLLVFQLYHISFETENHLRRGLTMIGLQAPAYWASWLVLAVGFSLLAVLVQLGCGYLFGFRFFTRTDPLLLGVVFLAFSVAMLMVVYLASVFVSKARTALQVGMGLFVLGMLFASAINSRAMLELLWNWSIVPRGVTIFFQFLPFFNFAKIMADINDAYKVPDSDVYSWTEFSQTHCIADAGVPCAFVVPSALNSLGMLGLNFLLFAVLFLYFDAVWPGSHGQGRHPVFFLFPSYWRSWLPAGTGSDAATREAIEAALGQLNATPGGPGGPVRLPSASGPAANQLQHDGSAAHEADLVVRTLDQLATPGADDLDREHLDRAAAGLVIAGLGKDFVSLSAKGLLRCRDDWKRTLRAVDQVCLSADPGCILAVLGHNGAGKTTTINLLTGFLSATRGDAFFNYGQLSLRRDLDQIRSLTGVCPQHDILWNDLTSREHLEFFLRFRGITGPSGALEALVRQSLQEVGLLDVADKRVSEYSGGMRRRLSVALCFVGDPFIVFLDEPTTGMDPYIRREVWSLLLRQRKRANSMLPPADGPPRRETTGRIIIMTTHSMEEADVLADKIAIISHGQVCSVGTSLSLKSAHAGWRLNLVLAYAPTAGRQADGQSAGGLPGLVSSLRGLADWMGRLGMDFSISVPSLGDIGPRDLADAARLEAMLPAPAATGPGGSLAAGMGPAAGSTAQQVVDSPAALDDRSRVVRAVQALALQQLTVTVTFPSTVARVSIMALLDDVEARVAACEADLAGRAGLAAAAAAAAPTTGEVLLVDFNLGQTTLEDVFLAVTEQA